MTRAKSAGWGGVARRALRVAAWCVVLAGSARSACGQSAAIRFEASTDAGATWLSDVTTPQGAEVLVRMRVELLGATSIGLAGFTIQPTVSNWSVGADVLRPFTFPGINNDGVPTTETAYDGRAVLSSPASNTGRIFPYGAAGMGSGSSGGLLVGRVSSGGSLWFAGSHENGPGLTPQWGVVFAQEPPSLALSNFNTSLNAMVFRFAITANAAATRTVGGTGLYVNQVVWHTAENGLNPLIVTNVQVHQATITTVPSPGVLGCAAVCGWSVARRRRRVMNAGAVEG
jgi:hypothetical protein